MEIGKDLVERVSPSHPGRPGLTSKRKEGRALSFCVAFRPLRGLGGRRRSESRHPAVETAFATGAYRY